MRVCVVGRRRGFREGRLEKCGELEFTGWVEFLDDFPLFGIATNPPKCILPAPCGSPPQIS